MKTIIISRRAIQVAAGKKRQRFAPKSQPHKCDKHYCRKSKFNVADGL